MDPSSNFSNYRTALRGATQRSETAHSSQEKVRWSLSEHVPLPLCFVMFEVGLGIEAPLFKGLELNAKLFLKPFSQKRKYIFNAAFSNEVSVGVWPLSH